MPQAVSKVETKRYDLESVPDGYVVIRKMTYGESLKVQGMSMRMHMQSQEIQRARKEAKDKGLDEPQIELTVDVDSVTAFMFSRCIIEHNLEDENGKKLNFRDRQDFTRLDTEVGSEIEEFIQEMNPDKKKTEPAKGEKVDVDDPKAPLVSVSGGQ
jgi:hypothetical protein